jgi:hypothetical protein
VIGPLVRITPMGRGCWANRRIASAPCRYIRPAHPRRTTVWEKHILWGRREVLSGEGRVIWQECIL